MHDTLCMMNDERCTKPAPGLRLRLRLRLRLESASRYPLSGDLDLQDTIFFHQTGVPRSRPFCSISFNKGDRLVSLQLSISSEHLHLHLHLHLRHIPCCAVWFGVLSSIISPNHILYHIISISDRAEIHIMGIFFWFRVWVWGCEAVDRCGLPRRLQGF